MDVKLVKLISGEDLIAQIIKYSPELVIKNPVKLTLTQNGNLGIIPFNPLFIDDTEISINLNHVILTTTIQSKVEDAYKSSFGGIITAKASPKILGLD